MKKIVNATDPKEILKELALEFISNGYSTFKHWETVTIGGQVSVCGDVKTDRSNDYYITTTSKLPTRCKFYNEITVSATCISRKDGEDVFECKIEDIGLTKRQLASFIKWVKVWSLDYK